jgi:hypothetical protein
MIVFSKMQCLDEPSNAGGNARVKECSVRWGHDIAKPKKEEKRKKTDNRAPLKKGRKKKKKQTSKAPQKRRKREENGPKKTGHVTNAYCLKRKRWRGL